MSNTPFNRFAPNSSIADTTMPGAPAAENEDILDTVDDSEIDPGTGKKTRKTSKPRTKPNVLITKEQKEEMLKRYATETPATIARDLGLEARQVYNVVRNTRLKLEAAIKITEDETKRARLKDALDKIPHKEFGGGASGPRSNTLTDDDIISALLG